MTSGQRTDLPVSGGCHGRALMHSHVSATRLAIVNLAMLFVPRRTRIADSAQENRFVEAGLGFPDHPVRRAPDGGCTSGMSRDEKGAVCGTVTMSAGGPCRGRCGSCRNRRNPGAPRRALCASVQLKLTHDLRALLEKPTPRLVTWRSSVLSETVHSMHTKTGQIGRIAVCC